LLYAPDKGKVTRDKLSYKLSHYLEEINELIDKLNKKPSISEAKQKGQQVVDDVQQQANDLKRDIEEVLNRVKMGA
ncbi:YtxH domain-containing protein, partial [Arthrospira platensis SPKY1]|nr:YtxH domain-containing protein [Arthrospira platensis SPKY1]